MVSVVFCRDGDRPPICIGAGTYFRCRYSRQYLSGVSVEFSVRSVGAPFLSRVLMQVLPDIPGGAFPKSVRLFLILSALS